jgi:hypothetical protein
MAWLWMYLPWAKIGEWAECVSMDCVDQLPYGVLFCIRRYKNFEELYLYCYRVAGTVGLMTLPVLGCAPGFTEKEAVGPGIPCMREDGRLLPDCM